MSKSIQISKRSTVVLPGISSYMLEVTAINAQNMSDKIFVKQRIRNFAKGEIDDTFVAVCTPTQLEDFDEDSPGEGSSYFRTNRIELVGRTAEVVQEIFDSLVYEVKKLVVDLSDLEKLEVAEVLNISAIDPITELLPAPTISMITGAENALTVFFSPPATIESTPIAYYQYSVDGGVTWADAFPRANTSPISVTGLENGVTYNVQLRAVNGARFIGTPSTSVYASTLNLPPPPVITAVTGQSERLVIEFLPPGFSSTSPVLTYEVSIDDGGNWTRVAPSGVTSPITIGGLTGGVSYNVLLRAISVLGYGRASLPASGIPT